MVAHQESDVVRVEGSRNGIFPFLYAGSLGMFGFCASDALSGAGSWWGAAFAAALGLGALTLFWVHDCHESGETLLQGLARRTWTWVSWAAAITAPALIWTDNHAPGALPTWKYVRNVAGGAAVLCVMLVLGYSARHPGTALKVAAGLVVAGVAAWLGVSLFESMTVKGLLAIIVVLLLLQMGERR